MKKFVAVAGAFALAACGSSEAEVDIAEEAVEAVEEIAMTDSALVGTYGGTTDSGDEWTSTLNADGTYEDTMAGEISETGTWTDEDQLVCFNPTVMEGETAEQTCMTLVSVNDDGSLLMQTDDGSEMTVPKLSE